MSGLGLRTITTGRTVTIDGLGEPYQDRGTQIGSLEDESFFARGVVTAVAHGSFQDMPSGGYRYDMQWGMPTWLGIWVAGMQVAGMRPTLPVFICGHVGPLSFSSFLSSSSCDFIRIEWLFRSFASAYGRSAVTITRSLPGLLDPRILLRGRGFIEITSCCLVSRSLDSTLLPQDGWGHRSFRPRDWPT